MPSEKPSRRLEDIIENGQSIQRYIAGMTLKTFEEDSKTYDAVERCLERISEAASKLGELGYRSAQYSSSMRCLRGCFTKTA